MTCYVTYNIRVVVRGFGRRGASQCIPTGSSEGLGERTYTLISTESLPSQSRMKSYEIMWNHMMLHILITFRNESFTDVCHFQHSVSLMRWNRTACLHDWKPHLHTANLGVLNWRVPWARARVTVTGFLHFFFVFFCIGHPIHGVGDHADDFCSIQMAQKALGLGQSNSKDDAEDGILFIMAEAYPFVLMPAGEVQHRSSHLPHRVTCFDPWLLHGGHK